MSILQSYKCEICERIFTDPHSLVGLSVKVEDSFSVEIQQIDTVAADKHICNKCLTQLQEKLP